MNRIQYTTTTTGTGALTLSVDTGYQALADSKFNQQNNSSIFSYVLIDADGANWEHGICSISGATLTRTSVLESTNSDAAISLSAGTHTVFLTRAGLEGMIIQQYFTVATPAAITGASDTPSFDTEAFDGIGAIPGEADISTDLPFSGTISSLLDRVSISRAVKATMWAHFTGNANGGMLGAKLDTYYGNNAFSGWTPNINSTAIVASVSTPWMGMRSAQNATAGIAVDNLNFTLYNNTGSSITPNAVHLLLEWMI